MRVYIQVVVAGQSMAAGIVAARRAAAGGSSARFAVRQTPCQKKKRILQVVYILQLVYISFNFLI